MYIDIYFQIPDTSISKTRSLRGKSVSAAASFGLYSFPRVDLNPSRNVAWMNHETSNLRLTNVREHVRINCYREILSITFEKCFVPTFIFIHVHSGFGV